MKNLVWKEVFQFQEKNGKVESLVWRRFAPKEKCVHSIGTIMDAEIKRGGRNKRYVGHISALVGDLIDYRNSHGHGFKIIHHPEEGIQHIHIGYLSNPSCPMTKSDRNELKLKVLSIFSDRSDYSLNQAD